MQHLLTDAHKSKHEEFKSFVRLSVEPLAGEWDREQKLPDSVISEVAKRGYLGCSLPAEFGGQSCDTVTFGLLNEALGRGSSALTGVLTVQTMVSMVLLKWGTTEQRRRWLPSLARGEIIGAFALTEPGAGSSTESLTTEFTPSSGGETLTLNGTKRWISCAQFASVFLVFGKLGRHSVACVVPREADGLQVESITDL